MNDLGIRIGLAFKRRRKFLGYTQKQIALEAGMSSAAVSQIETGRRFNNILALDRLATALGIRLWKIFRNANSLLI